MCFSKALMIRIFAISTFCLPFFETFSCLCARILGRHIVVLVDHPNALKIWTVAHYVSEYLTIYKHVFWLHLVYFTTLVRSFRLCAPKNSFSFY